jgi:hypothetical protein
MCSLSFLPTKDGFHLLMNRDEQRTRAVACPPRLHDCCPFKALYPTEPSGGTWIGLNERGLTIALINWYSMQQLESKPAFSRGEIIPRLLSSDTIDTAEGILRNLPLSSLNPFRIFMVYGKAERLIEYRSDALTMQGTIHPWERSHWFSSGYDEARTATIRAQTCTEALAGSNTDPAGLLRDLHRSHSPEKGPFSLCMHRRDARTVSFTEIAWTKESATMAYQDGPPCHLSTTKVSLSLPCG